MKGKPWTVEEENQLRGLIAAKTPLNVIAAKLGRRPEAVEIKLRRSNIEVVVPKGETTTTSLQLPKELISVEEALKILAGALIKAQDSGLDPVEVQRLKVIATLTRHYKDILSEYVGYRGIEARLAKMEEDYERLLSKEAGKSVAPQKADGEIPKA